MQLAQLNLPARLVAREHFVTAYASTHRAADALADNAEDALPDLTGEDMKAITRQLTEALCAARALENLLVGNPLPRRGE